jgi:RNA polymerase sigma-70 factor, ECF subfamily
MAWPATQLEENHEVAGLDELLEERNTIFLICLGYTRNRHDAEDLAQETFLRAHTNLARLRSQSSSKAWLCSIARNVCLDHLRRSRWRVFSYLFDHPEPFSSEDIHVVIEQKEQHDALKRAIRRLPAKLRDALVLREYGELSYEQIALTLDIEEGTVMSRLHRARKQLATLLGGGKEQ